jgi:hypothetical protein
VLHRQTEQLPFGVANTLSPEKCRKEFVVQSSLDVVGLLADESVFHALQELPFLLERFLHSSACCLRMSIGCLGQLTNSIGPFSSSGFCPSLLVGLLSCETSKSSASGDDFEAEVSKSCFGFLFVVLHHNKDAFVRLWETAPWGPCS